MVTTLTKNKPLPQFIPKYPVTHRCPTCGGSLIRRAEDGVIACLNCSREPRPNPTLITLVVMELEELKATRIDKGYKQFYPIDVERMRLLRAEGWSYRDIANVVGVCYEEVRQLLNGSRQYLLRHKTPIVTLVICLGAYSVLSGTGLGLLVAGVRVLVVI